MNQTIEINETNFESEVINSTHPVLVDFWADWCGPCKMLAPVIEELAAEQAGRVRFAKVDVEKNRALAERFDIQSIPTLLYFVNGKVRQQTVGLASKQEILSTLDSLAL